jgi:DNA polymerase-3 subunit alpha
VFTLENIPMDNPEAFKELSDFPPPEKAFELLASGDVTGVFQVEGGGMRRVLTEMKPTSFEHIVAAISLFRPGPIEYIPTYIARMHGNEQVEFKHPNLEPILSETYGIIVYQEQIIQIASQLAGYAPGEADQIRKAVGKKIKTKIEEHRSKFIEGAVTNGIDKTVAEAIYGDIEFFARYGFNKAHAADYALVTCQTAYLKAHYPIEYMTALLTVERGNTEKIGILVGECRAMGIEVLPPSINHGCIEFIIEDCQAEGKDPAIRFSLSAIKNVGEGPIRQIMEAREEGGLFKDVDDFCSRVELRLVGRRALEGLIKVGALDDFAPRDHLLAIVDRMINLSSSTHKASSVGQISMFDMSGFDVPQTGSVLYPKPDNLNPVSQREILGWEKELAGAYLSDHPIQGYLPAIKAANTMMLSALDESMHGQQVTVAGMINFVRHHQTKKGDPMAFVEVEDIQTSCEIVVFPRVYSAHQELLADGNLIIVRGKVDAKGHTPKILADTISNQITTYGAVDEVHPKPPVSPSLFQLKTSAQPVPPSSPETPGDQPNGAYGANGQSSFSEDTSPPQPPQTEPQSQIKPPQTDTESQSRWLHVTIPCTGNVTQDKHRLRMVYHLLTQSSGNDNFSIYIPTRNKRVRIDFPNQTTRDTVHLRQQLVHMLGTTALRVD